MNLSDSISLALLFCTKNLILTGIPSPKYLGFLPFSFLGNLIAGVVSYSGGILFPKTNMQRNFLQVINVEIYLFFLKKLFFYVTLKITVLKY